jgi:hypothetical protein
MEAAMRNSRWYRKDTTDVLVVRELQVGCHFPGVFIVTAHDFAKGEFVFGVERVDETARKVRRLCARVRAPRGS